MTTQTLQIPLKDYATGERTVERAIAVDVRSIKLTLQRCTTATPTIWPQLTTFVNLELSGSFDGGATWIPMGAWGAFGGIFIRRDGSEAQISEAAFPWPG